MRYAIQPPTTTATSCLSSRRAPTNNETKATATPTQSPTTGQNTLSLEKSPVTGRPSRKHVQFPDTAPDSQNGKSGKCTPAFYMHMHTSIPFCISILYSKKQINLTSFFLKLNHVKFNNSTRLEC